MGVRSIRCTNSGARVPPRFNFTTNLVFFIVCDYLLFSGRTFCEQPAAHFSRIGVTLTPVKDLPHSRQHGFNRDVINPQDGHILCDPYPAIRGFSFCILWNSRIVNSTISKPKEKLVAFIHVLLLCAQIRFGPLVAITTANIVAVLRTLPAMLISASDTSGCCSARLSSRVPTLWSCSTSCRIASKGMNTLLTR